MPLPSQATPVRPNLLHSTPGRIDLEVAVADAWYYAKKSLGLLIVVGLLSIISEAVLGATTIAWVFLIPTLTWGYYQLLLNVPRGLAKFSDYFLGFEDYVSRTFPLLAILLISRVMVIALSGLTSFCYRYSPGPSWPWLLLLPLWLGAVYIGLRLEFAELLVIDRQLSVAAALRESWRRTQGQVITLLLALLLVLGLHLVGLVFLGLGLLLTIPLAMILKVVLYRQLMGIHT